MGNINIYNNSNNWILAIYSDIDGISCSNSFLKIGVEPLTGVRIDVIDMEIVQNNHGLPFPGSPLFKKQFVLENPKQQRKL